MRLFSINHSVHPLKLLTRKCRITERVAAKSSPGHSPLPDHDLYVSSTYTCSGKRFYGTTRLRPFVEAVVASYRTARPLGLMRISMWKAAAVVLHGADSAANTVPTRVSRCTIRDRAGKIRLRFQIPAGC